MWGGRAAGDLKETARKPARGSCGAAHGMVSWSLPGGAGASAQMPPGRADKNAFM